jgi:starch synthase (maltosyl-transferring)
MKIYYLHPLMVGPLDQWSTHFERCRAMGFDCVGTAPLFAPGTSGDVFLTGDADVAHPILDIDKTSCANRTSKGATGATLAQ